MKPGTSSQRGPNFSRFAATIIITITTRSGRGASLLMARCPMPTRELCIAAFVVVALACATCAQAQSPYGIGRSATPAEIAGWNIDIDRDGNNLPAGSGGVSHGQEVFDQQCASCTGAKGEGGVGDRLVGGQGTLATPKPVGTVGSYLPDG